MDTSKEVSMPWKESDRMDQRVSFIRDLKSGTLSMVEACQRYGISRPTGYKWLERFEADGESALEDRPPVARQQPLQTSREIEKALVAAKRKLRWGPKKLVAVLRELEPDRAWPAPSTVGAILARHGLVRRRRTRRRVEHPGRPTTPMANANGVWTMDFKGQFKTGDGRYCYPLTVVDGYSRFLLACQGLEGTLHQPTRLVLQRLFREFGLPEAIRTDNGVPFASEALGRLSRLSVWWIKLGIRPELIEPSSPQQNGAHERMHRTLKASTARPAAGNARAQQRRFAAFRREYNFVRPHEGIGQRTPASLYQSSSRPYPNREPSIEYPGHLEIRRVSRNGGVRWAKRWLNISSVLAEENVGFEEIDDGIWSLYFGAVLLGRFDERKFKLYAATPYQKQTKEMGRTARVRRGRV
jgi:putative transposase